MIEPDTIRLLRECDAGIAMGVRAIEDVLPHVRDDALGSLLKKSRNAHQDLMHDVQAQLHRFGDEGKSPSPMAKGMSAMKTGLTLAMHDSDRAIASLMTDGCNMGVKSLNQYLNAYEAADEHAKDIAKRLIHLEEDLTQDMRDWL